ncbi:MAG: 3-deoxy-7-phosphoheptulonate synthase class II [Planctomycetes bacterium]|nr:3-deoxy-7-phosphoheptulonate synthase class II [Planctomycetota bacterium]
MAVENWSPRSWQERPATQLPVYPDPAALERVLAMLSRLPPLVTSWEIEALKRELAEACAGNRFLLQGGDCSESFDACDPDAITKQLKILLQMSLVLVHGGGRQVIRLGRFAGQYAKPRSSDIETRGGRTLPSYRGDMINQAEFTEKARTPDPVRLLRAYERSALTLNFIRALVDGGFADFHHPEYWDIGFVAHSPQAAEYRRIVDAVGSSLRFMETLSGLRVGDIRRVDFYASHEGLYLPYEQAHTRRVPRRTGWYNLSTHFPWIGDRTRRIGGAHVEYFRGIANPIGVKVGPTMEPDELVDLARILNPDDEPGRLTLIHRFGADGIATCLPPLIDAVRRAGSRILWCCDPMHGNLEVTREGLKTRRFDRILAEIDAAFEIHREGGSRLGGVHAELTGDDVTECIGGARGLTEAELNGAYKSLVDPRLNYEQALELALLVARRMAQEGR